MNPGSHGRGNRHICNIGRSDARPVTLQNIRSVYMYPPCATFISISGQLPVTQLYPCVHRSMTCFPSSTLTMSQGLLEIGQLFLENTGEFTVRTVTSGADALDLLSHTGFDAVISDYQDAGDGRARSPETRAAVVWRAPIHPLYRKGREEIVIEAINNGVDSYLQKGGDPRAQFVELAHRVRQAITRWKAEIALSDSEHRLADIINFLPDATFAIDTEGHVISWNRAIEEITGIPAREMLGKGDYEYRGRILWFTQANPHRSRL